MKDAAQNPGLKPEILVVLVGRGNHCNPRPAGRGKKDHKPGEAVEKFLTKLADGPPVTVVKFSVETELKHTGASDDSYDDLNGLIDGAILLSPAKAVVLMVAQLSLVRVARYLNLGRARLQGRTFALTALRHLFATKELKLEGACAMGRALNLAMVMPEVAASSVKSNDTGIYADYRGFVFDPLITGMAYDANSDAFTIKKNGGH